MLGALPPFENIRENPSLAVFSVHVPEDYLMEALEEILEMPHTQKRNTEKNVWRKGDKNNPEGIL